MKKESSSDKKIKATLLVVVVVLIAVLLMDYLNFWEIIGVQTSNFNLELESLIVGNVVVITIFLLTYFLIDAKSLKRESNKRKTALIALKNIYLACKEMAEMFDDDTVRENAAKHCDFNKLNFEDPAMTNYYNVPFDGSDMVLGFAADGTLTPEEFDMYNKVKRQYRKYVNLSILFFDNYSLAKPQLAPLLLMIDTSVKLINEELQKTK